MQDKKKIAFTVDVEDGLSIAMRDYFSNPIPQTNRVVKTTDLILNLLEKKSIKGTFFILGVVAVDFPDLIKRISAAGHEIGVHGFNHYRFQHMDYHKAKTELSEAKKILEDITGNEVIGHRAPAFSINKDTAWALDLLAELGFKYDSSIMPIKAANYGWDNFNPEIHEIKLNNNSKIIEVPLSYHNVINKKFPVGGGSYLRLLPLSFTSYLFKKVLMKRNGILYIHPYELDTERYPDYYFDELNSVSLKKRMMVKSFWINRSKTFNKLDVLTNQFEFCSIQSILSDLKYNV